MSTKDFICKEIKNTCVSSLGISNWKAKRGDIYHKLAKLQPTIPEDGTRNYIAFDVPNKDRMKLRTSRFLSRKMKLNSGYLSDSSLQNLSNIINLELYGIQTDDIRLLSGSEITDAYRHNFGASSCMTGDCCDYTRLYEANPKRFKLLTMKFSNDEARAVLSTLDDGTKYLDRVYGSSEAIKDKMKEYAADNNWQCYGNSVNYGTLVISNLSFESDEIPYMDTFTCGTIVNNELVISATGCCEYDLTGTDGELASGYSCENCGDNVHEDDARCTDDDGVYCQSCYERYFSYCDECETDCNIDDIVSIDGGNRYICQGCAESNYYLCDDCNKWVSESEYSENLEKTLCSDCTDSYIRCDDCDQLFESTDITTRDDRNYCDDCLPEPDDDE